MSSITSPYKDLKLPSVAVIQLYKKCLVLPGSDKPNYAADKTGANDGLQPAAAKKEVPRTSSDTTKEPSSAVTSKPLTAATPENIRFLGENRKGIVILVNYSDAVHMPDEH